MSSDGGLWSVVAIPLMKLAHSPMTVIREANWHALMMVKVTPMAPSWGAWNRIFRIPNGESNSVMSLSAGRSFLAVRRGKCGFGNGTVGGDGKELLAEMMGNWCKCRDNSRLLRREELGDSGWCFGDRSTAGRSNSRKCRCF